MKIFLILVFVVALVTQALWAQGEPMLTLEQTAKQISSNANAATPKLIDQMSDRILNEKCPSVQDEIAFLVSIENYEIAQKTDFKRTLTLLVILNTKHKDDPDALMSVLLHEIVFYRSVAPDTQKLANVVSQIIQLSQLIQNRQAIASMTLQVEIGESYRALFGGDKLGEMQNKAREYYAKALSFPIFDPAYKPSIETLKQLYVRAAIDIVEISKGHELASLRFDPYAWDEITKVFPEKAKLISHSLPGMDNLKNQTAAWLKAALQETDNDSEIHKQIVAVLEFLKTREY